MMAATNSGEVRKRERERERESGGPAKRNGWDFVLFYLGCG